VALSAACGAFVELRARTAFTFGDGAVTPEALAARAADLGYPAIGLTDAADLGGLPRFALEAERRGVKALVGAELVVDGHPLALLVETAEGYRNLAALVTRARVGELAGWEREHPAAVRGAASVTWGEVAARSAGLLALTGPPSGAVAAHLLAGRRADAARLLARFREVFGERLAVEVQCHRAGAHEAALVDALIELAERERVRWAVSRNPRYLDRTGRLVHDMLTALRAGRTLDQAAHEGLLLPSGHWRLPPPEEMAREWAARPEGLAATVEIAERCRFELAWMRPPLPHFPVPPGHSDVSWLRACVEDGARERWGEVTPAERAQLDHEITVIERLGFSGFFLVMWDAVRKARELGILCQGRGSAANSAVAYCLGVTAVDPVANGLLFERFLSDARVDGQTEAPDIDLDIEHDRREELLDYVYGRYDRTRAAITCVVQHYRAPNALLDGMRALGYPVELAHQLSKRMQYAEAADGAELLRKGLAGQFGLGLDDARGRALLAIMRGCDELPRLRSTHVGGFVLSAAPLGDWLPIEHTTMGRTIIQFDKDDLDAIGVPKFDFLGLGGLSLVRRAFDAVEARTGTRPAMYRLPPDDPATYALISRGDTIGTFQIESRAQIASILHTKPERIYDLVVQVALIRPGPIQAKFVHPYTRRRRGWEPVTYPHPALEPILRRTQGIPIFQEQAMAIAMRVGRSTAAEADVLRRAMGHHRKQARLARALDALEQRMTENGLLPEVARQIRQDLESFGNYGFPESHAWSFALIAYATAYLKCHYPAEFFMAILNAWPMGFYPPSTLIHDARRSGVEVRPPCLRDGRRDCTVEPAEDPERPALRVGWRHIRGAGARTLDRLEAAQAAEAFTSIRGVVRRAALARADVLHLAEAGAFAAWEPDRRRAAWEGLHAAGDVLPLAPMPRDVHEPRSLTRNELVFLDYHATGTSILGHPMDEVRARLRAAGALDSRDLQALDGRREVLVGGLVTIRQRPLSANGTVFLLLEDEHGFINVIVPEKIATEYAEVVKFAPFVVVLGRFERDGEVRNVVSRRLKELQVRRLTHTARSFR
jgi:error-prone DNA polymerase